MRIHDETVVGTQFGIGLSRKGKPVLRHIFIGKYRRDPLHPACIFCLDLLHPGVRVGTAEQFDDQTVFRRQIVCIHRFSCYQRHSVFFSHRSADVIHSLIPSFFCAFLYARYLRILLVCPTKPEHLQRFPARYSWISSSVGSVSSLSMAKIFMIKPGLQNPHCSAPSSARKLPNSSASFCIPSIVTIFFPSARSAGTLQDRTGLPSIRTVQSPQLEVSQP